MNGGISPVLFISHGAGPAGLLDMAGQRLQGVDRTSPSANFMRSLGAIVEKYQDRSSLKCIVVVTAHWEEPVITVDYQLEPPLVYDYYGFPNEAYAPHLTYPVKSDLQVADRVVTLLKEAGLPVQKAARGLDHGTFVPLKLAYPAGDVPVVQVSLKSNLDILDHIRLGEALRPLRHESVLLVGSGQITHSNAPTRLVDIDSRAVEFTDWMWSFLADASPTNYEAKRALLVNIAQVAPHYAWAHGRPEHFLPLAVAFGASFGVESHAERLYREVALSRLALDCYIFSSSAKL